MTILKGGETHDFSLNNNRHIIINNCMGTLGAIGTFETSQTSQLLATPIWPRFKYLGQITIFLSVPISPHIR